MTAESKPDKNQSKSISDRKLICDDTITLRCFAGATILWGLLAAIAGAAVGLLMLRPDLHLAFVGSEYLSYGRLRPGYTAIAVYGFAANAAFTAIYYSTQRLCKRRMWSAPLSWLHFLLWQACVLIMATTIPMGMTQGKQFAEMEWSIDLWLAIAWILFFGVNFSMTIAMRREKQMYVSLWFYIATVVSLSVYQIANVFVLIVDRTESHSLLAGSLDALVHAVWVNNVIILLLTMPFIGLIYYFVPKASGRPIYSYKLAIVQFWTMIAFFYWVGPARLHFTAISDFPSSLAMLFGLILWMPAWGGVVNGLLTIRSAADRNDPVIRFLTVGIVMFAITTFFSALLSIKSVSAVLNYTDWMNAQLDASVFGCCGMLAIGMIYWLIPKLFQCKPYIESLVTLHFWIATTGLLLTVIAGYAAGLWQGLSLGSLSGDTGNLTELEFLNTVEQVSMLWWIRVIGLCLMALGMLIMGVNYWVTWLSRLGKCDITALTESVLAELVLVRPKSRFADAPMLDVAKEFDIWRRLDWHRLWERDASKFVVLPLIVMAIATLIQVVPTFVFPPIAPKNIQPYTPLELAGREIFIAEGCVNCHTQMVRRTVAETKRYGDFSQDFEFVYDHPSLWGHHRVGPDLAREGGKKSSHWHWVHLSDPRDDVWGDPRSVMPSFAHLASDDLHFDRLIENVELARKLGVRYSLSDEEIIDGARAQAERIAADVVAGGGPIWTERYNNEPLMIYDSQAIALIAYLQRLGTDLFKPPPVVETPVADVGTATE